MTPQPLRTLKSQWTISTRRPSSPSPPPPLPLPLTIHSTLLSHLRSAETDSKPVAKAETTVTELRVTAETLCDLWRLTGVDQEGVPRRKTSARKYEETERGSIAIQTDFVWELDVLVIEMMQML